MALRRILLLNAAVCVLFAALAQAQPPALTPLLPAAAAPSQSSVAGAPAAPPVAVPALDVISVKPDKTNGGMSRLMFTPDGISTTNVPVHQLLTEAYHLNDDQLVGEPDWVKTERFDIEAKVAGADAALVPKLTPDQRRSMFAQVLTERFGLVTHHETRELPEYVLTVAKSGSKLVEDKPDPDAPKGKPRGPQVTMSMNSDSGARKIAAQAVQTQVLLQILSREVGRTVVDKTGLAGSYDFTLTWTPDEGAGPAGGPPSGAAVGGALPAPPSAPSPDAGPGLFTAIQEQLGLKLEPAKEPVDVLVIDHIERPSEN